MNGEPLPTDGESRRVLEWVRQQKKNVSFSVPTRMPNEPQANEAQLAELRELGVNLTDGELSELGTWQAAAAIERMRQENQQFTEECKQKWIAMQYNKLGWCAAILATISMILLFRGC
jgi:hypothetical protein